MHYYLVEGQHIIIWWRGIALVPGEGAVGWGARGEGGPSCRGRMRGARAGKKVRSLAQLVQVLVLARHQWCLCRAGGGAASTGTVLVP